MVFVICLALITGVMIFLSVYWTNDLFDQVADGMLVGEELAYLDETIPPELLPQVEDEADKDDIERNLIQYTIQKGDTLSDIARRYGVSITTLHAANVDMSAKRLKPGEKINVPPCDGVMVKVNRGDNLWSICRRHSADLESALAFNQISNVKSIRPGDNLFLPGGKMPVISTSQKTYVASAGSRSTAAPLGGLAFAFPVRGRLTSRYGWRTRPMGPTKSKHFHTGIDIAAPHGRTICAAESGQVISACYAGALGNTVVISHRSGYSTVYGHAAKLLVKSGQQVKKGEPIALVGSTGRSTGPHVHFEVRKGGKHVDPMQVLK